MCAQRSVAIAGLLSTVLLTACGGGGGGSSNGPQNYAPTAQAGSDLTVKRSAGVTLSGSGTDVDGDTLAYRWVQVSGTPVTLSSSTSATPSFTAPDRSGTLSFSLTTSDGKVDSAPDSVSVIVENAAPTAMSTTALSVGLGAMATLDATASTDPDGDPLTYTWNQLSGPSVTIASVATGISQFQVPNVPAVIVLTLTVSDGEATSISVNITVNVVVVTGPNVPPSVSAGSNFEAPRRSTVALNGWVYDSNYDPVSYSWEQVAGPTVTLSNADTLSPTFTTPETPARLTFALHASDGVLSSDAEVQVEVRNFAPYVANAQITPVAAYTNDVLAVDAQAQDPDNDPLTTTYQWRRNGAVVGPQTSSTFPASLTTRNDVIAVRVTVDDGFTQTTADASTTILDSPAVLSAQTPPPTAMNYGDTATFNVTATDPDGDAITGLEIAFGPAGMGVNPQGQVTWTAAGPLFDRVTDFNWGVRVIGDESSLLAGTIEVTDAARKYPLRRTNMAIPVQHSGLYIADLDADGDREMLVGSSQAVYVLSRSGSTYRQSWVYPFGAGGGEVYANGVNSVTAADVNGDNRQEIFFSKGDALLRLDGVSRREAASRTLRCRAMEVADVDGNGAPELVCLSSISSSIYDSAARIVVMNPKTLAEIWSTAELPLGSDLALGNVDNDAALEIVTAGGFVFDGQSHQNQWAYSQAFGSAVDTGDMDGDTIEEIVGMTDWTNVRAFSAVLKSPLWEYVPQFNTDLDTLTVADADGDGRAEAIIGNGQWGYVTGVGFNTTSNKPEVLWQINSQEHGVTSIAVGDVDADGTNEVVWGTGATSSGRDDFVIAGFAPTITVEWQSSSVPQIDGPMVGGALARIGGGASRVMYITPRSNSGYGGLRVVALNPTTTALEFSSEIGTNWASSAALSIADYDNDNVDELFIGTAATYNSYFAAYDFAADSIGWQSPQSTSSDAARAIKQADMNGDGHADLVGLSSQGYIDIYDVHSGSLIWRSTRLGSGVDLALSDLDGDGEQELIVALTDRIVVYGQALLGSSYVERASAAITGVAALVVADLDGDDAKEVYVLRSDWGYNSTLSALDDELQVVRSVPLGITANGIFVEESAFDRKNLLLAVSGTYPANAPPELWAIDPRSGANVWHSPALGGTIQRNSLFFIDTDNDGDREISFGTTGGMYLTR